MRAKNVKERMRIEDSVQELELSQKYPRYPKGNRESLSTHESFCQKHIEIFLASQFFV